MRTGVAKSIFRSMKMQGRVLQKLRQSHAGMSFVQDLGRLESEQVDDEHDTYVLQ